MKVWIDQDLCTGDGLCEEIAPDVFTLLDGDPTRRRKGSEATGAHSNEGRHHVTGSREGPVRSGAETAGAAG